MTKNSIKFSSHGYCELKIEGNLLYIYATGPWNIEFFNDMHQQLLEASKQLDINNYAVILVPKGEALAVEDAIKAHTEFLSQVHCKAVAVVLVDCLTPSLTQKMCSKIYNAVNIPHAFFNDFETAEQWLKGHYLESS